MFPRHSFVCAFAFTACVERAVGLPDDAEDEGLCQVSMLQREHQLTQTPKITRRVPEMASFAHARGSNDSAELRQLLLLAGLPNQEPQRQEGKSELSRAARIGETPKSPLLTELSRRFAGEWDWDPQALTVANIGVLLVVVGALIGAGVCLWVQWSDGSQQSYQEPVWDDRPPAESFQRPPAESFQQQGYARQSNEDEWNQRQRGGRDETCC